MINYSDENILETKVKKCLTFDPFRIKSNHPYGLNSLNLFNSNPNEIKKIQLKYYECTANCFDLYENINILKYHYELSCLCIKKCFNKINYKAD